MQIPVTDKLSFQGEVFQGENLSPFLGGIGQGVSAWTRDTIRDTGGWFDFAYDWTNCVHSRLGAGVDNPNDADVFVGRSYNRFIFTNIEVNFTEHLTSGVELAYWRTHYVDARPLPLNPTQPGESCVIQWTVRWAF